MNNVNNSFRQNRFELFSWLFPLSETVSPIIERNNFWWDDNRFFKLKVVFLLDSQKFFKVIVDSLIVTNFLIVNLY